MRGMGKTDVPLKEVNWQVIRSLSPYLLEYRGRILLALLCLVAAKLASVGLPFILKYIVDDLDTVNTASGLVAVPLALLVAYGAARFANVLFAELRDTLFGRVTERAIRRIGLKVFRHLHALDLGFHLNRRTGGLSRDIERGTNGVGFLLRFLVFNIVPTLLEIGLVIGILLWNYQVWFAVATLLAVVAYVGYSVLATEWRTKHVRQMNKAESASSTRAVDSLLNYETVKYFTNEQYEASHYDRELATWEQARRKNRLSLFTLNSGQQLIISIAITVTMILAAMDVSKGVMTLGDFVLINAFMMQIFMPLNFLGFVYREIKGSLANIDSMFKLLAETPKVEDKPDAPKLIVSRGEIEFRDISFSYHDEGERQVLNKVSFMVPAKQKVAIVGSSGAGKSTILKLLFRFYDAKAGSITIDGQNITEVTQGSLRGAIGVVPQDTVLFNTTLLENIRYGRVDASDADVSRAIAMAHLQQFITELPKGGETLVGERGLKLSGGEKQRVAIARTILKNPAIMVFDEATSSLDSKSEQSILDNIREVARNQTSLVVAHRLSTVIDADSIVVLDKGRVVEQGSHSELLASGGKYAELWQLQQQEERIRHD